MDQIDKYFLCDDNYDTLVHLYEDKEDYDIDFQFFSEHIIQTKNNVKQRFNQTEFREELIKRYKCCVVSGFGDVDELEACHIVPYTSLNTHIHNGILLNRMIHKTFDKYLWSIHPETFCVEVSEHIHKDSSIMHFKGKTISIDKGSIYYLKQHYSKFCLNR
jgi:predicted restriction endonuclease